MSIGKDFNLGPMSNPLLGGVRMSGMENGVIGGIKLFNTAAEDARVSGKGTSVERTTVSAETRIEETNATPTRAMASIAEQADYERQVDEMLNQYITPESRERMASTSFNVAMAMYPMDIFVA